MIDFFSTVGGQRFINGTIPKIGQSLERIAQELRRGNNLKESECQGQSIFMGEKGTLKVEQVNRKPLVIRISLDEKPIVEVTEDGELIPFCKENEKG